MNNPRHLLSLATLAFLLLAPSARADDWPQWLGPQRDGVWRETGILEKFPEGGPKIRWRVPVGAGYSSPAVVGNRVYLTDRVAKPGAPKAPSPFARISTPGVERVLCLDAADGKTVWSQEYPCDYTMSYNAGPRAAPVIEGERVYTLGAEGDLQCRDTKSGKLVWQQRLGGDNGAHTPMWGFAASPLIEGDKLITLGSGPEGVAVAFNKETGAPLWKALPAKEPGYCAPIVIEAGGKRQLIVFHPEGLNSLDPDTGKVYWSEKFTAKFSMTIATPQRSGDLLFVTTFYNGSLMMRLDKDKPAATVVWKIAGKNEQHTASLHGVLCTPAFDGDTLYGVCSYGQLRGIETQTGKRLWETFAATTADAGEVRWANAFITPNAGRYFLFNEKGDLIIATLTPAGYQETSRAHLLDPTNPDAGRLTVWSQPAYANRCIFARNDKELLCASLAAESPK